MCSPKKLAQIATIGVATAGLVGCINSNINVGGDNNTQIVGDDNQTDGARGTRSRQAGCDDHASYVSHTQQREVCREYHDHTDQCVGSTTQATSGDCDPRWFVPQAVSANYLNKSQFFACNAFEDRNRNGLWSFDEIEGGPRNTFRTDESIALIGWELSDKKLHAKVYDSQGNRLFQQSFPEHRGGHRIRYAPHSLPAGTYTVTWERDECGQGQWNERGRQTITVVDCSPRVQQPSTHRYDCHPSSNPGIVESIK